MKEIFELMASYNQLMNKNIYGAACALSEADLVGDRGAFFGSVLGTLNHILVGDIIWLKRFAKHPVAFSSLDYVRSLDTPASLDTTLCSTLSALAEARYVMDDVIVRFTSELTDEVLSSSLTYCNTKGIKATKNVGSLVQHLFNHQTHHRGQVSTLLNQSAVNVGVTDLLMSIADE